MEPVKKPREGGRITAVNIALHAGAQDQGGLAIPPSELQESWAVGAAD
jgi:hypothetical protein